MYVITQCLILVFLLCHKLIYNIDITDITEIRDNIAINVLPNLIVAG